VIVVSGAVVSTVQLRDAGEASTLPALSTAATVKVCVPSASPESVTEPGLQLSDAPSSVHWNVPASVDVYANVAPVEVVVPDGPELIVVSGAVRSIVHVFEAGVASTFPAASMARTWNVWLPAESPLKLWPLVQGPNAPASSAHWNVEPDSLDANWNAAVDWFVGSFGAAVMLVSGGVVSMVHG
jgi:hypothetical protein